MFRSEIIYKYEIPSFAFAMFTPQLDSVDNGCAQAHQQCV